jgi:hypothetical protein
MMTNEMRVTAKRRIVGLSWDAKEIDQPKYSAGGTERLPATPVKGRQTKPNAARWCLNPE